MENRMDTERKDNYRNIKNIFYEISSFASRLSCISSAARTTAPVILLLSVLSKHWHIPPFLLIKGNAHLILSWTSSLFISLYLPLQAGGLYLSFWARCYAPNGEKSLWMEFASTTLTQQPRPSWASQPLFLALPTPIKFCFFPKRRPLQLTVNQRRTINNGQRNPLLSYIMVYVTVTAIVT